ncbi:S-adenosyl-L-methionine-dependent methyltransferase [Mycena chlorophos]|uniref:S-adenosyl-L-methionine-dependent methyltransferase n=1 Tax=Mycena chlorophos TaxID=658473 RepID=A0A8H6T8U6_MYCCL|nr:S-adenosyl-L-methionine-dependent methyltransferase [Mycena chlorophos]
MAAARPKHRYSESPLRALLNIISTSVDAIDAAYASANLPHPSLDAPYDPHAPGEALRSDPGVAAAAKNIIGAAAQMIAELEHPFQGVTSTAYAFHQAAAISIASHLDLSEILHDAGPGGVALDEIASKSGASEVLLAKVLRLLATQHIFREVKPGVFTNNRLSSTLNKGKPYSVLARSREERLVGTSGRAALIEFTGDECFKASAALVDVALDRDPKDEQIALKRAFALGPSESLFQWHTRPENKARKERFACAMQGTAESDNSEGLFQGFEWGSLPYGALLVDVGSGTGGTLMRVVKRFPGHEFRIVNQDLEGVIETTKRYWKTNMPAYDRVSFQTHDFLTPQPYACAASNYYCKPHVFVLRHILHNWPTAQARVILRHLRAAAGPETQLVVLESALPVVCRESDGTGHDDVVPGAARPPAPRPLLANGGRASASVYRMDTSVYRMDMTMYTLLGGSERTIGEYAALFAEAGWRLERVCRLPGTEQCHIVARPGAKSID